MLIGKGHRNRWTAALSIAANRASKVTLLREHGCDDIAARNLARLNEDVEEFIAANPNHPPRFAVALREAATPEATQE